MNRLEQILRVWEATRAVRVRPQDTVVLLRTSHSEAGPARPEPPSGVACGQCGIAGGVHGRRYAALPGWHLWMPPGEVRRPPLGTAPLAPRLAHVETAPPWAEGLSASEYLEERARRRAPLRSTTTLMGDTDG